MIKIIHVIAGLGSGGAENMLYKLLKYSDKERFHHEVISLIDEGVFGAKFKNEGIKIHSLKISKRNFFASLLKAREICKDFDIVNTWLYHADIFGFIISKILLNKKLIWNIRHSNLDKDVNKKMTLNIIKINSFLSRKVDCITYNSQKALKTHSFFGYKNKNNIVIPNGFELNKFKYDANKREIIRKELGVNDECKVLITVGRWDVQKDYDTLIKSLNEVKKKHRNFKMIMVGTNLDKNNTELLDLIIKYDLMENMILLGRRNNVNELLSAADCYISSSLGESFSNSIGEAMACELHCIVTDVGDSKYIVGETGIVVPAGNYSELAGRIYELLEKQKIYKNSHARDRIMNKFNISFVINIFEINFIKTLFFY